ncbi:fluoride efflux transporter CrcB [Methanosphaera sp. ISO3-F5]|uniref:fluoride efflux transporter CrcB n=1 Tax=Methanosphaera sp. ISO3-F5 TaxID=1452353 RepID=UPI002B256AA7|nr:fluoride efflux transporter CrcB [Methanosphaera sp. ISO3-F5]WQH63820.1 fluoride efflux transporter CrcB [Methanosphaera sp. ISO3-F5]
MLLECLAVGLGGFIGSVLRYIIGLIPIQETSIFPINTFIINILGTVLISIIAFYITQNVNYDENLILFLKVGLCGGFTTFSTFALETGDLIKSGNAEIAFIYVLLSVIIGVTVIFIPELLVNS